VILQESGDFTWRVSDYEELVGVTHRRWWGLVFYPHHHKRCPI